MTCNPDNDKLIWKSFTTKNLLQKSFFVANSEKTPFLLKSDLNINNFALLLRV